MLLDRVDLVLYGSFVYDIVCEDENHYICCCAHQHTSADYVLMFQSLRASPKRGMTKHVATYSNKDPVLCSTQPRLLCR